MQPSFTYNRKIDGVTKMGSEPSKSVHTILVDEAALLLDGDERPLAIDDLPVENVVADDENGCVLRGVVV